MKDSRKVFFPLPLEGFPIANLCGWRFQRRASFVYKTKHALEINFEQ